MLLIKNEGRRFKNATKSRGDYFLIPFIIQSRAYKTPRVHRLLFHGTSVIPRGYNTRWKPCSISKVVKDGESNLKWYLYCSLYIFEKKIVAFFSKVDWVGGSQIKFEKYFLWFPLRKGSVGG